MEDYLYWQDRDKKTIKRIDRLIKDIGRNGCWKASESRNPFPEIRPGDPLWERFGSFGVWQPGSFVYLAAHFLK